MVYAARTLKWINVSRPTIIKRAARKNFEQGIRQLSTYNTNYTPPAIKGSKNLEEVEKFNQLSKEWWDTSSTLYSLRLMNTLRVPLIRDTLTKGVYKKTQKTAKPLSGYRILDVGCGGGFLSEPLARLGASVLGIDPGIDNIGVAKQHASLDPKLEENLQYQCSTLDEISPHEAESFDAVVVSEVIEHVTDKQEFIEPIRGILKPNGHLILTTISRTIDSILFAKLAAEYILQIAPKEAHDWELFITEDEMFHLLYNSGYNDINFRGMGYNPVTRKWRWTSKTSINYACTCSKPE